MANFSLSVFFFLQTIKQEREEERGATFRTSLKCIFCGREYEISPHREDGKLNHRFQCINPSCVSKHKWIYGSLELQYDYEQLKEEVNLQDLFGSKPQSMWHYKKLLPVATALTLGEGATSMIYSERLVSELDIKEPMLKYEGTNPTGSFKDRESAVAVSRALEIGAKGVACVSSGNAAASLASYAAHAGLSCLVFTPTDASIEKQRFVQFAGARLVTVDGIFEDVWELVNRNPNRDLSISKNVFSSYYDCNPALNPYRSEGDKTTAYEIYSELQSVPDWVVIPIGNGSNLVGIWKGFKELQSLGVSNYLPRILGVQVYNADPIAEAWRQCKDQSVRIESPADSVAEGIVAKDSYDAPRALRALKESNGVVASVTDGETLEHLFLCMRREGIFLEPTSATVLAAAQKMKQEGVISLDDRVVFVLTGSGLKTMDTMVRENMKDKAAELYERVSAQVRI